MSRPSRPSSGSKSFGDNSGRGASRGAGKGRPFRQAPSKDGPPKAGSRKKPGGKPVFGKSLSGKSFANKPYAEKPAAQTAKPAKPTAMAEREATAAELALSGVQMVTVKDDDGGMRLDRWFKRYFPSIALSHLNKITRTGQVRVNAQRVDTATRLEAGQVVRVPPVKLDAPAAPAVRRPAEVAADQHALRDMTLFEDAHVLVLNKPHGLAVQGGSGTTHHIDGMLGALANEKGERPVLVHRLDRDTSGVLLIAKTRKMASDLGELFRSRQTRKIYWAIVEGVPRPPQGRISLFLAKGPGMGDERPARAPDRAPSRRDPEKMRIAKHGEEDAQHSVTFYATLDKVAPRLAWLSMRPITGRTHQLRAHAEAIGHPIIGDPKYTGDKPANDPRVTDPLRNIPQGIERKLHLLARRLILPHPKGGMIDVTAPLPAHMQQTFDLFGFDVKQYDPIEDAPDE